jgi:transposase
VEVLVKRCAGLDVGKADVKACVRLPGPRGGRRQQIKTFATTGGLLRLRAWLVEQQVTVAGIEATGDYWKPVYYLFEDAVEVQLLNAAHMHNVPGRKTDVTDAAWIARLTEHGLVRLSFVPPPPIRRLRDLTRYRAALIAERTREKQRMEKLLEDAGIKLSVFVSDLFGVSGRAMLAALVDGERDPQVLAGYAHGRMRPKIPALAEALTGRFDDHHAFLCRMMLGRVQGLDAAIEQVTAQAEAEITPFQAVVDRLDTIPGVNQRAAQVIVAELGVDMSRFPTPAHLASWAGMCPGNNESTGKHFSGRTRKGDRWLRAVMGEAAAAAIGRKDSYPRAVPPPGCPTRQEAGVGRGRAQPAHRRLACHRRRGRVSGSRSAALPDSCRPRPADPVTDHPTRAARPPAAADACRRGCRLIFDSAWRHRAFEEGGDGTAVPEVRCGLQVRCGPAGVRDRQADRAGGPGAGGQRGHPGQLGCHERGRLLGS